ncbi:Hypothetical protein BCD_1206 (plasmid) [Borrelia crocidurae DOU]|uniref:Lipoprotein n=2 Tax=Borrelia crocidurae TaxID=29520 RepID=W5SK16_9SPIR|nr:hypothetical protein [Borrelia crocidurae]AHH07272.1 Hypothetical protein BCD_1206 [Borrelia crocidurae DOU]
MGVVYKFFLSFIFIFFSCNFDVSSKFFTPLEDAIKLEISRYESLGNNKFKTYLHSKNYFESVKDINGYSYYFILDKTTKSIVMEIILFSRVAVLLDYKFGFIFNFGFNFDFLNVISPNIFEFQVKKLFKKKVSLGLGNDLDIKNDRQISTYNFNLRYVEEINREFENRNHKDDLNSSTSELMYFVGSSEYSVLRETYIVLYYYVFKAIERFMQ